MKKTRIYVASSWRNDIQPFVVDALRRLGHEVYDFKNPPGRTGFAWSQVDPKWKDWTPQQYRDNLECPVAQAGFDADFHGMQWAEMCVLVLPCGRSAHSEAGFMSGSGKPVFVYMPRKEEPELMYKLFSGVLTSYDELENQFSRMP